MKENIKYEGGIGGWFLQVAQDAQKLASKDQNVEFEFNGIKCVVSQRTDVALLHRDYTNSHLMDWKEIGPDSEYSYNSELLYELYTKTKAAEKRRAKERAEWEKKDKAERKIFEKSVKGIELELSDIVAWNKCREVNSDGYGGAALDYAEGWAKKMQIEIAKGKTVAECATYTQDGLGFLGITGFQFGCAMRILSQAWKHGEELRVWHNAKYNHKGDGVVNPAILTINTTVE